MPQHDVWVRTIIDTVVDGIVIIDEQGLIRLFNAGCRRLFGYSPEEAVGQNVRMLMPPPYAEQHDGYLQHYRDTGEKRIIGIGRNVQGRRRDGSVFPMYLSVGELPEAERGEGGRFVGIIHDMTEEQRSEQRTQDLQAELLHVSRLSAMGQMAAAIAHELNQPLTAATNFAAAAERLLADKDGVPPKALEFIAKAGAQAERAGQIIRRLRRFVERGEIQMRPEPLAAVLEEGIGLALIGFKDAGVRTALDIAPDLPAVAMDRVQIQQVVINLVRNAVEAMQDGGRRDLTIRAVPAEKGKVAVSVIDTGPGLAPEVADQLFQPFVTTKSQGMGVGLSICRSIVEAHGGALSAAANPGGGTIFRFTLRVSGDDAEEG